MSKCLGRSVGLQAWLSRFVQLAQAWNIIVMPLCRVRVVLPGTKMSSIYRGVSWNAVMGKWMAVVWNPQDRKAQHIGNYRSEMEVGQSSTCHWQYLYLDLQPNAKMRGQARRWQDVSRSGMQKMWESGR